MTASPSRSKGPATMVFAVVVLVSLHLISQAWLVAADPYPARYDYDEGVYATTAAAAAAGDRLYSTVFLSQPPLLIGVLARAFDLFGRSLISARGTVVGFSLVWLTSLAVIAGREGRARAGVWAVAVAGSAVAFVGASHTIQMEGSSEALAALAVALGLAAAGGHGRKKTSGGPDKIRWALTGLAAGLAVMTKFTALTCLVPLALITATKAGAPLRGQTAARVVSIAAGGFLAAAATIVWTAAPPAMMWQQAVLFHGAVARALGAMDPGRAAALLLDFAAANWFLTALGLIGAGFAARAWGRAALVTRVGSVWLAADFAAVFLLKPVWPHHLVILVTPLVILGAAAVEAAAAWLTATPARAPLPRILATALIAGWVAAVVGAAAGSVPKTSAELRAAVATIRRTVPAGTWIIADDPMVPFLAGRAVPPGLCDTSETRVRAGWLTATDLTAAVGDPRVQGVVLWRGTFRTRFPEFAGNVAQEFPRRWTADNGREVWTR